MIFYWVSLILVILPLLGILSYHIREYYYFEEIADFLETFTDSILFKIYYFAISVISIIIILLSDKLELKWYFLIFCQIIYVYFSIKKNREENSIIKTEFGNMYFSSKEIDFSDEDSINKTISELRENINELKNPPRQEKEE